MTKDQATYPPRVRFNWGFWDGRAEGGSRPMSCQDDRLYAAGYRMGAATIGQRTDSTNQAWATFRRA